MDEKKKEKSELEKFIEENKEVFEKFQKINEEVEEEMEEIAKFKAEHPELFTTEKEIEITNEFIENNSDLSVSEIVVNEEEQDPQDSKKDNDDEDK